MGATVGFSFRFADGFVVTNRGSLEAEGAFLGAGRAGSGGGPCGGSRVPKAEFQKLRSDIETGFVGVKPN